MLNDLKYQAHQIGLCRSLDTQVFTDTLEIVKAKSAISFSTPKKEAMGNNIEAPICALQCPISHPGTLCLGH